MDVAHIGLVHHNPCKCLFTKPIEYRAPTAETGSSFSASTGTKSGSHSTSLACYSYCLDVEEVLLKPAVCGEGEKHAEVSTWSSVEFIVQD